MNIPEITTSEPVVSPVPIAPSTVVELPHVDLPAAATLSDPATPEGGKGGDSPETPPHSPPLGATAPQTSKLRPAAPRGDDVFTPAPVENPVLVALRDAGLYGKKLAPGKHQITCPWSSEHEEKAETDAIYYEPRAANPVGGFRCHHPHETDRHIGQLLDHLDVDSGLARCKDTIRIVAGELTRIVGAAERILASNGNYYQSGGGIVCIQTDPNTGDVRAELMAEPALAMALSTHASWERYDGRSKDWVRTDPAPKVVQALLRGQSLDHLPILDGLARQPFFRKSDGKLVTKPGYDPVSRIYAAFDPTEFPLPEPTEAAAKAALTELKHLIGEFRLDSSVDVAATLSAILTATVRPSLAVSPAFNITASGSGSGKSYLASMLSKFAGPGEAMNVSYPASSEEATKAMLALFMTKPAVVVFDDMQGDWLPHGVMNRMLTSPTIADRVLSASRTMTVSTASFIMGTGNNIEPVRDMCRRVVSIYLNPRTASPATLRYEGRPVETMRSERGRYVAYALTIIRAWQAAGSPKADVSNIATFEEEWANSCRHPLIWLGEPDPATTLLEQIRSDPASEALGQFMVAWHNELGSKAVTVRSLIETAERKSNGPLYEALTDLPVMDRQDINRTRFGWFLKKNEKRVVNGLQIRKAPSSERNAWAVVPIIDEADPINAPPSPPLVEAIG